MKLFLPQATLESWVANEQADLRDGKLWISEGQATHPVTPAVHFRALISGADDQRLISKVKTDAQLKQLGAEQMMDSVLLGETAYEVTPGYVTEVSVARAADPKRATTTGESEMLAAFLLDKLT